MTHSSGPANDASTLGPSCNAAVVDRIIKRFDDTGYTIMAVKIGYESIVAVCTLPFTISEGQEIEIEGQIYYNAKYGTKQIKATNVRLKDPTTADGVRAYLSSGVIAGIGPSTAEKIVDLLGDKTLEVLDDNPRKLLEIRGIGEKKILRISASWKDKREGARIMSSLQAIGLTPGQAAKTYKHYDSSALYVIKENPYRLADEVSGIGFKTADAIALKLGFAKENTFRIKSGILYTLKRAQDQGHCFLPGDVLLTDASVILEVEVPLIKDQISSLLYERKMIDVPGGQAADGSVTINYYLPPIYEAERYIESRLKQIATLTVPNTHKISLNFDKILTAEQRTAAEIALKHKFSIITGAAGTGKSTILLSIIKCMEDNNISYYLCAPTGKAAKRITEVTGREAQTIHRLIGFGKGGRIQHNETNPLECDYVIVDEASMIDTPLMAHLLRALPPEGGLLLLGDQYQLAPVGVGQTLADCIASGICPVTRLQVIQRQKKHSSIISIATSINQGVRPVIPNEGDSYFFEIDDPERIAATIVELFVERIPTKFGILPQDIQILSPMRKGIIGTENLNYLIHEAVKDRKSPELKGFRLGDKVIQTVNNYSKNVFNGDLGYVSAIDTEFKLLYVSFAGIADEVEYELPDLDELSFGFCLSIHRYQGSQSRSVIVPIHTTHYKMMRRALFYTAVTRTRELLVLLGTKKAMSIAVKNDTEQKRHTGLFARGIHGN